MKWERALATAFRHSQPSPWAPPAPLAADVLTDSPIQTNPQRINTYPRRREARRLGLVMTPR